MNTVQTLPAVSKVKPVRSLAQDVVAKRLKREELDLIALFEMQEAAEQEMRLHRIEVSGNRNARLSAYD